MTEIYTMVQVAKLGLQAANCMNKVKLNDDLKRMEVRIQEIQTEAVRLGNKVANAHFFLHWVVLIIFEWGMMPVQKYGRQSIIYMMPIM